MVKSCVRAEGVAALGQGAVWGERGQGAVR